MAFSRRGGLDTSTDMFTFHAGYGRVGADYTHHATYTGGCLMEGIGRDSLVEEGWRTRGREAVRAAVLYTTLLKLPV